MSLTVTPKQARLWALVLLGTVVTLAGVLRGDAVLLTAGATFLGVPALMSPHKDPSPGVSASTFAAKESAPGEAPLDPPSGSGNIALSPDTSEPGGAGGRQASEADEDTF